MKIKCDKCGSEIEETDEQKLDRIKKELLRISKLVSSGPATIFLTKELANSI